MSEKINEREAINEFLKGQHDLGVKRNEIARSLFHFKFSTGQIAKVLEVHPKTAHAMKEANVNGKRQGRLEIKNYLKGSAIEISKFRGFVKGLVGSPSHTKEAEREKKRARKEKKAEVTA